MRLVLGLLHFLTPLPLPKRMDNAVIEKSQDKSRGDCQFQLRKTSLGVLDLQKVWTFREELSHQKEKGK